MGGWRSSRRCLDLEPHCYPYGLARPARPSARSVVAMRSPFNDQPQKLDKVKCRHSGNVVTAQIQRRMPSSDTGRMWHFEGRAQGNLLYGIFFSRNEADLSYGTIQLHKHDEFGLIWKGTYSRLRLRSEEESWVEYLPHIPLEWNRDIPIGMGTEAAITSKAGPDSKPEA
jgi:hypothetical protein